MKFFYQAIQRDSGIEVKEEIPTPQEQQQAPLPAREITRSGTQALVTPATGGNTRPVPHNNLQLARGLEKLVAGGATSIATENLMAMEQCRNMRTRLIEIMRLRRLQTLMVTSGLAGEGKTLTSINLAFALSQIPEIRVLLIEADMRRPSMAEFLGIHVSKGFNSCLNEGHSFEESAWRVRANFDLLPSFGFTDNSAEMLHSRVMEVFLASAKKNYDTIILDAPPLHPIADSQVLASHVDGAILVVRAHSTPVEVAKEAALILGNKLVGTILNGAERLSHSRDYYKNQYRYTNPSKR